MARILDASTSYLDSGFLLLSHYANHLCKLEPHIKAKDLIKNFDNLLSPIHLLFSYIIPRFVSTFIFSGHRRIPSAEFNQRKKFSPEEEQLIHT